MQKRHEQVPMDKKIEGFKSLFNLGVIQIYMFEI